MLKSTKAIFTYIIYELFNKMTAKKEKHVAPPPKKTIKEHERNKSNLNGTKIKLQLNEN